MKLKKLKSIYSNILFFTITVLFFSCQKEQCTQNQFVGTYTGTRECSYNSIKEDYEIEILPGQLYDEIIWHIDGRDFTLMIEDCRASYTDRILGFGSDYVLNKIDESTLSGHYEHDFVLRYKCEVRLILQ